MADELREQVLAEIRRLFAIELERSEPVEPGHELLRELQVDSLSAMVLAVGLEDRFRVKLTEEDTLAVVTVADLVGCVVARVRAAEPA